MIICHSLAGLSVQMDEDEASMEDTIGSSVLCPPSKEESQGYNNTLFNHFCCTLLVYFFVLFTYVTIIGCYLKPQNYEADTLNS